MMKTIDNKYHTWYNSLVERARNRVIEGYTERHHIIPKSLGGTDEPSNIVALTAREHLIAHMLLPRFVDEPGKMWCALWGMMNTRGLRIGSRVYEEARIRHAQVHSAALKGRLVSEETRAKLSAALRGRQCPGVSAALKGRKRPELAGIPRSEETKAKISAALKGRPNPGVSAALKGRPNPVLSAALKGRKRPEHSAALKGRPNLALKGRKQADWVVEAKRQRMKEYWAKKKLASSEKIV